MGLNEKSRLENSRKNVIFAVVGQMISLIFSFVNRTLFIHFLKVDYLGVNGLFSNILTVLSFAELGIGNAIIYSMYKPIAEHDTEKIKSLMKLYRTCYTAIGVFVLTAGLLFMPFIRHIIKEMPDINDNLYVIYLLFLARSVSSYVLTYKRSMIVADQKNYVTIIYTQALTVLRVIMQMIVLVFARSYILYLIIEVFIMFASNVLLSIKADKMYPFLKDKNVKKLPKEETTGIFKDVKGLVMYRASNVVMSGTDNIIISKIVGMSVVGLCSNYVMVIEMVTSFLSQFFNSFTASVGNLNATTRGENGVHVFNTMYFASVWVYGFIGAGLFTFLNDFISIWLGPELVISVWSVGAMALNFFITGVNFPGYVFRTTMGFFLPGRYAPVAGAILNIVLSVILGKRFGVAGILFATSISNLCTLCIVDPMLVFKLGFGKTPYKHYVFAVISFAFVCLYTYLSGKLCSYIVLSGFIGLVVKCVVFSVVFNILMIVTFFRTKQFSGALEFVMLKTKLGQMLHRG